MRGQNNPPRNTQAACIAAGQWGVKKWKRSVALLVAGLPVGLLLGLGSCAARVPVTVSADSPPNEHTEAEAASAEDLEYGGSGLGASGGANGLDGGAPNGE